VLTAPQEARLSRYFQPKLMPVDCCLSTSFLICYSCHSVVFLGYFHCHVIAILIIAAVAIIVLVVAMAFLFPSQFL